MNDIFVLTVQHLRCTQNENCILLCLLLMTSTFLELALNMKLVHLLKI